MSKYTFLIPAYKSHFLSEMLQSIFAQTYTDYKVIINDDCSPENLWNICEPYLNDKRFTYHRNEKNIGQEHLVAHWNMLVDKCDTDYLILASDDDIYDPSFLSEIDSLTTKYPEVDLVHARARVIDDKGVVSKSDALYDERVSQLVYISQ